MKNNSGSTAVFTGLVDLASQQMGGKALATSDEFFAGINNLIKPGRGEFIADKFTEHGKWMDGWESRRKRTNGYDWCMLRLGVPGVVRGLDIDTNHFIGNHAPFASVEGLRAPRTATISMLQEAIWTELLPQSALRPGSQNLFAINHPETWTHIRLNIFPDGGVARFRAFGDVDPNWENEEPDLAITQYLESGEVDLAAMRNGGLALACSDMFFGEMNNLILPGRAANMGEGWETRRRRGHGHDWVLLKLAAPGTIGLVEIDTNHFKGNFPNYCTLEGIHAATTSITDLLSADTWQPVLADTYLRAHDRKFVRDEIRDVGPFTHLRFNIFPDGGVSRLRIFGCPTERKHS